MRIFMIILISFIFVGLGGGVMGMYYYYVNSVEVLEQGIYENIEIVIQDRVFHVEHFFEHQKEQLKLIATRHNLSSESMKDIVQVSGNFDELFIVGADGKTIASSDISRIGWDRQNNKYFLSAKEEGYIKDIYFSETTKEHSMTVSIPHEKGVLVARINLDAMVDFISEEVALERLGVAYFVNRDYFIISSSDSRWNKSDILRQKTDNENLRYCFGHDEENGGVSEMSTFLSYSGEMVLGRYKYIPEMDWCLLVEFYKEKAIDEPEALLLKNSLMVFLLILILTTVLGWLISRFLSRSVEDMTKSIDEVAKGNLDIKLKESRIKEVQSLVDSLNKILVSLKLAVLRRCVVKNDAGLRNAVKAKEECDIRLKQIVENTDQFFYINNIKGEITYASPQSKEMFGYTPEEMNQKWDAFITDNPINKKGLALTQKLIETGLKQGPHLFEIKRKDGKTRLISVNESSIKNQEGKVVKIIGVATDVTDHQSNSGVKVIKKMKNEK